MPTYHFGPFELDEDARRLARGGEVIPLADRHVLVLLQLVSRPGAIVSKSDLIDAAWRDIAVTDNSLEQAISTLRRSLDPGAADASYIDTVARQGYRFAAAVTRVAARATDADLDAALAPHRAWLDGRAALETLSLDRIGLAQRAFEQALAGAPDYAPAHVGLANAMAFRFEATRADEVPDLNALASAISHAREACRLQPGSSEPWATLGFALYRQDAMQAAAALRRAVDLEPDNWRHHLRLAFVGWGEERLAAAHHALTLLPDLALGHWLAATVHVARQSFDLAERELAAGAAAQDAQPADGRFSGVGLHWLRGLLRLRNGDARTAQQEFERELAGASAGHLYSRETAANSWYAIGAVALRDRRKTDATRAFGEALSRVPHHPCVLATLSAAATGGAAVGASAARVARLTAHGNIADAALVSSVALAARGEHREAAETMRATLATTPRGSGGWILPVEPMLDVGAHADLWAAALVLLRQRAA